MNKYLDLTKEQFKAFMEYPTGEKLQMLNLLKFKDKVEATGKSGGDQYKDYLKAAAPFTIKANAKITFYGTPKFNLIGPKNDLEWDKVLIVEYPTKNDFIAMITNKDYPANLRKMALSDSRLIFCSLITS